jgi:hypothetical protein
MMTAAQGVLRWADWSCCFRSAPSALPLGLLLQATILFPSLPLPFSISKIFRTGVFSYQTLVWTLINSLWCVHRNLWHESQVVFGRACGKANFPFRTKKLCLLSFCLLVLHHQRCLWLSSVALADGILHHNGRHYFRGHRLVHSHVHVSEGSEDSVTTGVSDAHNLSTRCNLHVAFHDTFFRFGVGLCKVLYHFWCWAPLKQASTVIEPVSKTWVWSFLSIFDIQCACFRLALYDDWYIESTGSLLGSKVYSKLLLYYQRRLQSIGSLVFSTLAIVCFYRFIH